MFWVEVSWHCSHDIVSTVFVDADTEKAALATVVKLYPEHAPKKAWRMTEAQEAAHRAFLANSGSAHELICLVQ